MWELTWYENFGLSSFNSFRDFVYSLIFVTISGGEGLAEIKDGLAGGSQFHPFTPERQSFATQTFGTGFAVQRGVNPWSQSGQRAQSQFHQTLSIRIRPCSDKAKLAQVIIYCFTK